MKRCVIFMRKDIFPIILFVIVIFAHFNWFFSDKIVTSGDWRFHNIPTMIEWLSMPYAWNGQMNIGSYDQSLPFYGFKVIYGLLSVFDIPFNISERLLFLWPSVLITTFGMYYLAKKVFESPLVGLFSSLIYSLNTYILIIYGAHLTVAMAYAMLPVIFFYFKTGLEKYDLRYMIISGLLLAITWIYESRIGYIISITMIIYIVFSITKKDIKKRLALGIIPFMLTFMIHGYWIIPSFTIKYSDTQSLFPQNPWISWMDITHAALLSHPFWTGDTPTIFVANQPYIYMIFLPLLAFGPILLLRKRFSNKKFIIFLLLVASIGIFLVKQENPPFGYIYTWLFHNFPGFNIFREASKFYILIAFSYSLLIGFSIKKISDIIIYRSKILNVLFLFLVLFLILYTARPAFLGEMGSAYQTTDIPDEYKVLNRFIENQPEFFRTYWYPTNQRFGYYSNNHPIISHTSLVAHGKINNIFHLEDVAELPDKTLFNNFLDAISAKYVIIPYDSENDIYKYYGVKKNFIKNLRDYSFREINTSGNIVIFENKNYQDRFYMIDSFFERIEDDWILNNSFVPLVNMTLEEDENNFNGESDYITIDSSSFNMTTGFTIDVSVTPKYMNQSGDIIVLRNGYNVQYGIIYTSDERGIKFGASLYNGNNKYFFENDARTFDRNYQVSVIYDGKYLKLCVDGNKIKRIKATGKLIPLKGDLLVGKSTLGNKFFFGKMKSMMLYDVPTSCYELRHLQDPSFMFNKSELYNFDRIKKTNVDYTYVNPTLYKVRINASKPFMLTFAESYDPSWIAHVDKTDNISKSESVRSIPLYYIVNGFWINQTGNLDITIEYEPQKWFNIGIIVSIVTLISTVCYLIYDWRKKKNENK